MKLYSFGNSTFITFFSCVRKYLSLFQNKFSIKETGSSRVLASVIEPISKRYPGIFQLGSTLGEDWDLDGDNLLECLASHCQGFSRYRRELVDDAKIWLTWDDEKLERYTPTIILYDYKHEDEPGNYPNARAFWETVVAYVEQDLEREPS